MGEMRYGRKGRKFGVEKRKIILSNRKWDGKFGNGK